MKQSDLSVPEDRLNIFREAYKKNPLLETILTLAENDKEILAFTYCAGRLDSFSLLKDSNKVNIGLSIVDKDGKSFENVLGISDERANIIHANMNKYLSKKGENIETLEESISLTAVRAIEENANNANEQIALALYFGIESGRRMNPLSLIAKLLK